ncbi:hypothetical protein FRC19_005281 [Serendipita sp. 401]|nr:hypothetical protein FRC15_005610 [Serendipita sp. 397]KAG8827147.1 hypothetical protein FRC19_005281 [Serendipita sp. 401]
MNKEGKWPPNDPKSKSNEAEVDVMRFAGRPNFVSVVDSKDTPASVSTPEQTTGGSPPHHPLLTEYLKKFQSCSDGDTHAFQCGVGFPPEQSMFPHIMSMPDNIGTNWGDHVFPTSPSLSVPSTTTDELSPNGFGATYPPLEKGMAHTFGASGVVPPYFGSQMNQEMFVSDASALSYLNVSHTVSSLSQSQSNEPAADDGWQEFLTGLQVLPQDAFSAQDWRSST